MLITKYKSLHLIAGAITTFNFLTLKLVIKNPSQAKTFPGRVFRDYMSLVEHDQWMSKDILDIFPVQEGIRITIEHLPGQGIGTPVDELAYLALITKAIQPQKIFEIGTFRGRTALNFAMNSPENCVIYTLDLAPEDKDQGPGSVHSADALLIDQAEPGVDYKGKEEARKIRQLYGNSMTFDYSPYYDDMDLVFIDGAHHYEAVKSDTENALNMVKPGGYILWHDFANFGDYNDVTRAILDVVPKDRLIEISNSQLAIFQKD